MQSTRPLIGVLSPLTGGFYFGGIIAGVAEVVHAVGGQLVAVQTIDAGLSHPDHLHPSDFHYHLAWRQVDGWVINVSAVNRAYLRLLKQSGKPVVMISDELPEFGCASVMPDNQGGVRDAVAHLVQHGHRRIAFAGNLAQKDIQERYIAYQEGLRAHGIQPDPSLLFEAPDNVEAGGQLAAQKMLAAGLPSTATIAATDYNALGVINTLTAAGYSVPQDQAIIGFDDIDIAPYLTPSLSSVRQPFEALGRRAGKLVLAQLAGEPPPEAPIYIPTLFVARESCGCMESEANSSQGRREAPAVGKWQHQLIQRLDDCLERLVKPESLGDASAASVSAQRIVSTLESALEGRTPLARAISDAWRPLIELRPQVEILQQMVDELRRAGHAQLAAYGEVDQQCSIELERFLITTTLEISRLQMQEQFADINYFWSLHRSHYEISMDLLRNNEEDIRMLGWMRWTNARLGALGMWRDPAGAHEHNGELEIVGLFNRAQSDLAVLGHVFPLDQFPPLDLIERCDATAQEIVFVVPVKVQGSNWGLLVIVGQVETKFATGRETFNQWAALLALAIERETMLDSVRRQREELAQAVQRERELVESVRASEERYALAARAANDGLWDWDLRTDTIYYSDRWKQMLGFGDDEIGTSASEWLRRIHPDDYGMMQLAISHHLEGLTPTLECEHRVRSRDGHYRWMLCRGLAVREEAVGPTRVVGSLTDITERRRLEERLRYEALYDTLTGLPNRKLFLDRLQRAVETARRQSDQKFAVLFLDLDGFKIVNDSLGHMVGDQLLIAVAKRLQTNLRATDMAARFGGDEFAILLGEFQYISDVLRVTDRLQRQLSLPFQLAGHQVVLTASIGIAISLTNYERAEDVLRDADIAMYRAKASGKGTHTIFDATMHKGAMSRLQLETELRQAVAAREFELHYQPIVQLATSQIVGVEALLRWRHPSRGLVSPGEFLPVLEETGLIVPVGWWSFEVACQQLASWNRLAPLTLSVNLSNKQFWHPDLVSQLGSALAVSQVEPHLLRLEITEGVIMSNPEAANEILNHLYKLGIQIQIDDFGTGYSSLEALHRFPIQALKIDRSFVSRLDRDDRSAEITRTIIMMGHNLGVSVIAEGIETEVQQKWLRALNCEYGQGYLFAKPMPGAAIAELLTRALPV